VSGTSCKKQRDDHCWPIRGVWNGGGCI
jgi:hypothetical protein